MAKAAKTTKKQPSKKKVSKYHEKIKIEGTFEDVMKVLSKPVKKSK